MYLSRAAATAVVPVPRAAGAHGDLVAVALVHHAVVGAPPIATWRSATRRGGEAQISHQLDKFKRSQQPAGACLFPRARPHTTGQLNAANTDASPTIPFQGQGR